MTRGKKTEKKCKSCGGVFYPRVADVNRGWGKFCNKSCKAKEQENRTGQYLKRNNKIKYNPSGLDLLEAKKYNAMTVECEDSNNDCYNIDDIE